MSFFKVNTSEENVRDYSGNSAYITTSGIYECVIKHCVVDTTPNGSQFINLFIEHEGQLQPIYQAMRLTNNDGSVNLGAQLFNKLCIVSGANENTEINDPVQRTLPIGKNKENVECMVLEDFNNVPVYIRIQQQYKLYNGKIQNPKIIRNFFRYEDKATASEIVNDSPDKGTQYNKELEYASIVDYRDGLTEEDIKKWISGRNSTSTNTDTPKPSFSKRSFAKK